MGVGEAGVAGTGAAQPARLATIMAVPTPCHDDLVSLGISLAHRGDLRLRFSNGDLQQVASLLRRGLGLVRRRYRVAEPGLRELLDFLTD